MQRRYWLGLAIGLLLLGSACGSGASRHGILFIHTLKGDPQVYPIYRWQADSGARRVGKASDAMIDPQWSPDGKQIAFAGIQGGWDEADPYEIYVMRADGTQVTQLTNGAGSLSDEGEFAPSWSPDGARIVFARALGNRPYQQLVVLSLRTGQAHVLPEAENEFAGPVWGEAGIVYAGKRGIMLLDPGLGLSTILVPLKHPQVAGLALSPHGELAVLVSRSQVVLYSAKGRKVAGFRLPSSIDACGVSWSPDGKRLLLGAGRGAVWTVGPTGKQLRRLPVTRSPESCTLSWR